MPSKHRKKQKKYFTPAEASNMLPLVRAIVKDITELSHNLRDQQTRLEKLQKTGIRAGLITPAELEEEETAFASDMERLQEYAAELAKLGVELKDFLTGLVDFPCWMEGREICLCWKQGEAELGWWHEVDAGFRGRQPLNVLAEVN